MQDLFDKLYCRINLMAFLVHSRYFFERIGRIRAVEVRPQKFRENFFRFGRISSIVQPKNLLIWGNFAQIERNSPKIFRAKLNCADSPISGEKNNYCVTILGSRNFFFKFDVLRIPSIQISIKKGLNLCFVMKIPS
jgi:hypothetical protein